MWVCINTGFVSIVEDFYDSSMVFVRGRRAQDVIAFAGEELSLNIQRTPERDYQYRIHISKAEAAKLVADHALKIDYTNFKDSVKDEELSRHYTEVWYSGVNNLDPDMFDRQLQALAAKAPAKVTQTQKFYSRWLNRNERSFRK